MRIVFASSEVGPFSKTGGLADVAAALPAALVQRGHEVLIVTPRYKGIDVGAFDLRRKRHRLVVPVRGRPIQGGFLDGTTPAGVPVLFVDQPTYFERDGLYGAEGKDFPDNDERFSFFSRSVLEACRQLGFAPDIIHCNDWQTGPIPVLLEEEYRDRPELNKTGTVFTIHNLGYQGLFHPESMMTLGLSWDLFTPSLLEFFGKLSFLKAGLVFADKLTTVSRKYAEEIMTQSFGFGLEGVLRERAADLRGILNGVDYSTWDPRHDQFIAAPFGPDNLAGKQACKADLQQRMNLPVLPDLPLIGCVSRLSPQKGLDLFLDAAEPLLQQECQWVFLGSGDPSVEMELASLAQRFPQRMAVHIGHNEELAHRIEAGADLFLMPSRYEPCGLNQIYSLRYGTLPVVHAVGGLDDTIEDINDEDGNGFKFSQARGQSLLSTIVRALSLFSDRSTWRRVQDYAMNQDFSWDLPARRYESLYREVVQLRS